MKARKLAILVTLGSIAMMSNMNTSQAEEKRTLLVSAISGPEGNLERSISILSLGQEIKAVVVATKDQEEQLIPLTDLLSKDVAIARMRGVDAFYIHATLVSEKQVIISHRYLHLYPSTYQSFDLIVHQDEQGNWVMTETDSSQVVKWIYLKKRTMLGVTIGAESYHLSYEKPKIGK